MKTVEQVMRQDIPTIASDRTVAEAARVVSAHDADALPVVADGRLVGLIEVRHLLGALPYRPVTEIMRADIAAAGRDTPVAQAYTLMEQQRLSHLPVVDGDRLVGLIRREDVLRELGRPVDPLTTLPWGTTLRERAEALLREGREIAVIFLDLDNFGLVNKQLGHVIGDQLIRRIATALQMTVDPARDLLCRYGGDEFAVLTTRAHDEAEDLARRCLDAVSAVTVSNGLGSVAITASMGLAGGKRTGERSEVHYAATVDDLITIASLQSTQAKIEKARAAGAATPPPARSGDARPRLVRYDLAIEGAEAEATVELDLRGRRFIERVRGPGLGSLPVRLLAEAAAGAVRQALGIGWVVGVEDVRAIASPPDTLVVVTIVFSGPDLPAERHTGAALSDGDLASAVVKAALQAINRRFAHVAR